MWGLMDQEPLELLAGLIMAQKPLRVLVIGGGSGLLPLLICQLLLLNDDPSSNERVPHVVSVELGDQAPNFPLTKRQEGYILKGGTHCFINKAITLGMVSTHIEAETADSYQFFRRKLAESKCYYDLIVVDGNHDRDAAMWDLICSWKLLSSTGVLFVDDYGKGSNSGVTTAVEILSYKMGTHPFYVDEQGFAPKACFFMKSAPGWSFHPEVQQLLD
jgi:Methyltransferase domain